MPVGSWTRDFSPTFARMTDGSVVLVDARYPQPDRPNEDMMARALAAHLGLPRAQAPLAMYGGNLLSNGRGVCCFTSAMVQINQFLGNHYSAADVAAILSSWYGFDRPVMLDP